MITLEIRDIEFDSSTTIDLDYDFDAREADNFGLLATHDGDWGEIYTNGLTKSRQQARVILV